MIAPNLLKLNLIGRHGGQAPLEGGLDCDLTLVSLTDDELADVLEQLVHRQFHTLDRLTPE